MGTGGGSQGKSKRRKLTPFLCQEMLFDYVLGHLDAERKSAVEEFLKTDRECREILDGVRAALAYAEGLGKTRVREDIVSHLQEVENAVSLGRKYSSWKHWPETLRWSVMALAISVVVAGFVAVVPWNRLPSLDSSKRSDVVELADLSRNSDQSDIAAEAPETEGIEVADNDSGSGDEEMGLPDSDITGAQVAAQVPSSPTPPSSAVAVAAIEPTPPPAPPRREVKPKGFVYRAFMNLGDLEEIGPKIADHIVDLGGAKAGEVELGWKRGSGRYYHFSLPEESEEKLLEKLRAYGPVRISKDPHGRVMPDGQVRFILWVEPL